MAQTLGQNATDGSDRWAERLEELRPWQDRPAVRELLEEWAPAVGPGGAEAVAQQLWIIGHASNLVDLTPDGAAGVAFYLLRNVAAGRDVLDYGPPVEIMGLPERTWRRWRSDWPRAMELLQYDLDLAAEAKRAPSVAAARQRLRRRQ